MPRKRLPRWMKQKHPVGCICVGCSKRRERGHIWEDAFHDKERAETVVTSPSYYPTLELSFEAGDVLLQGRHYLHPDLR